MQPKDIGVQVVRSHETISPDFVFPNYQDYGYGIFLLDDKSRDYILKNIQYEKDDFLRSMMWGSLWDSVRASELDPTEYVELAIKNVGFEKDESTIQTILARVSTAMTYYRSEPRAVATGSPASIETTKGAPVATAQGSDLSVRLESMLIEKMSTAPTLGLRITYYRAFLNVASSENARKVLKEMLRPKSEPRAVATGSPRSAKSTAGIPVATAPGSDLPLKTKDRFDIVTKLASLNDPDSESLLKELEKTETTDDAKRYAYAARAAFPTKQTKEKFWNDFTANKDISESWIEAAFGPFNSVRHADLTLPYLERALKELPNHKRNRKIFFVNGWLATFIGGQRSEEALNIINKFLADNPDLDRDLRLKILENVDLIERAVKIRAKFATR
jgi:aminopeptidase N